MIFVLGKAGSSKTTTILKTIKNNFMCLAYTHSAIINMKRIYRNLYNNSANELLNNFQTIHHYFRIDYNNKIHLKEIPINLEFIIIDEFTLIPLELLNIIFNMINKSKVKSIFIGDFLQLPSINNNNINYFNDISNLTIKDHSMTFYQAINIYRHLSRTCYFTKYYNNSKKIIMKHNYRCNTKVLNILKNALDLKFHIIDIKEIYKYKDYTIIGSKYELLYKVYKLFNTNQELKYNSYIGRINIQLGDIMWLTQTIDNNYLNGDEVEIKELYESEALIYNRRNEMIRIISLDLLIPINYITFHKSQGKTINNVLMILDDLFEITMLYTGITRAKDDIQFINFNPEKLPNKDDVETFKILDKIIYP